MSRAVKGCLADCAPWTARELATLRRTYEAAGIEGAKAALPGRSEPSLYHKAARLGLKRRLRWTESDDKALRNLWEDGTALASIASRLGRTELATYYHARKIGLPAGVPPGWERLYSAATRAGYQVSQLRHILRWAGVSIRCGLGNPSTRGRRRYHIVDPEKVDRALERWHSTEPVHTAARRLGVCGKTLRDRLRMLGLKLSGGRKHTRVTEEQARRAMALLVKKGRRPDAPRVNGRWACERRAA